MPVTRDDHYYDHERDLRKHEPRPGEPDYVPLFVQSPRVAGALDVAIIAKAVPIQAAADLIEQYAQTVAAGARLEATAEAIDRCVAEIDKFGARNDA